MNRRLRNSLVAVCATALLVSCGGEDDNETASPDPTASATSDTGKKAGSEGDKGDDADEGDADSGDTDADAGAQPYVDAISTAVTTGQFAMDQEQAQCFGAGVVDEVGLKKLKSKGTAEQIGLEFADFDLVALGMDQGEGEDVYDALGECGYDMRSDLLESLTQGQQVDDETKACIEDAVDEGNLRQFVVTMMTKGNTAAQESKAWQQLSAALGACEPTPAP